MDNTLKEYDRNLKELEQQKEKLKVVMQMMGQEWEESGPGIGWLGSLDIPDTTVGPSLIDKKKQPVLTSNLLQPTAGPSPEYLQSLLHINESLLAQSLANDPTPMLSPSEEDCLIDHKPISISSPLITPEDNQVKQDKDTLTDDCSLNNTQLEPFDQIKKF